MPTSPDELAARRVTGERIAWAAWAASAERLLSQVDGCQVEVRFTIMEWNGHL